MFDNCTGEICVFFWSAFVILHLIHFFLFLKAPPGRTYYLDEGYIIVIVACSCLGLLIAGIAFTANPCASAVGYCGSISCIAGNIYYQGYVFTFIVLVINAYISLRSISFSHEVEDVIVRQNLGASGNNDRYVELEEQATEQKENLFATTTVSKHLWLLYDSETKTTIAFTDRVLVTDQCSSCWNWNVWVQCFMRIGLAVTTISGILPVIAYDDPNTGAVYVILETGHTTGISIGVFTIIVALIIRLIGRAFRGENSRIAPAELLWTKIENSLDFCLLVANIAVVIYYILILPPRTPASWFCTGYKDHTQCLAEDRNISALLQPWPCRWDSADFVPCQNPTCDWEKNAQGLIVEYFVLTYLMLFFSSFATSISGGFATVGDRDKGKCLCCSSPPDSS